MRHQHGTWIPIIVYSIYILVMGNSVIVFCCVIVFDLHLSSAHHYMSPWLYHAVIYVFMDIVLD